MKPIVKHIGCISVTHIGGLMMLRPATIRSCHCRKRPHQCMPNFSSSRACSFASPPLFCYPLLLTGGPRLRENPLLVLRRVPRVAAKCGQQGDSPHRPTIGAPSDNERASGVDTVATWNDHSGSRGMWRIELLRTVEDGNTTRVAGVAGSVKGDGIFGVHHLEVSAGFRRRGLGRALLMRAEGAARGLGCGTVTLRVLADNHAAVSLYAAEGFEAVALRPRRGRRSRTKGWLSLENNSHLLEEEAFAHHPCRSQKCDAAPVLLMEKDIR